jgi:YD repeat-containing protein
VQYAYDAAGNVLKQAILGTDGECLESSTRYDLKDRATHRTNPAGGVTRYLYDRNDRLRKEINPYGYEPENDDGAGVSHTYDSRGNRLRTTNALGEVVQELSYNLRNQPVIQKDTFGNRTELSYELDGKIKDVRRSGNHQRTLQQYEYNARGQITGVVDGNRNPISYDVDSWGRITGIGFVDGGKEGYEYTPAGQVSRTIDGNGNAVRTVTTVSARSARELISWAIQRPSGMTRRATCPCTSTGMEDSCSAPATYSDSLCMRRRPMQRENIPTSAPGTMTAWAG